MNVRAVLAPALLVVLLTGCAAGQEQAGTATAPSPVDSAPVDAATATPTGSAATTTPSPTAVPAPTVRTVAVTYAGGQVTGTSGREEVPVGEQVVLRISSDVAEEVHVHGYDLEGAIPAGGSVEIPLTASIPGVFEVELHDSGKVPVPAEGGVIVLAHGIGGRADLPVPLTLALYGAGLAVVVSFLALVLLWRRPRLQGAAGGRPLPAVVERLVDGPVLRPVLRAVVLVLTLFVLAVALSGPPSANDNLAPYVLYVTLWVGLIPASLLLGPVWAYVNPLRTLHAGLARLTGPAPAADRLPALGLWPAAAALLCFVWLELVLPDRADPRTVGVFLVLYGVAQLVAALWFGEGWFARGDGFEVYSRLLGRMSPVGRRDDGRLVLRSPLDGVDGIEPQRGQVAVVMVLLGSTGYDGLSRTQFWQEGPGRTAYLSAVPGTFGLLTMIALAALLFVGATVLGGALTRSELGRQPGLYAHSLVPIAAGYAIAHYFSLLLLDGQTTWILASNPFAQPGVDLFGTYGRAVDYTAVSTRTIAVVQVSAIVLAHVLGVVLAHDRAVRETPRRSTVGQVPLVAVMVGFTVGGLSLLLSS